MKIGMIFSDFPPKIGGMPNNNFNTSRFLNKADADIYVYPLLGDRQTDYNRFPFPVFPISRFEAYPTDFGRLGMKIIWREIINIIKGLAIRKKLSCCDLIHTDVYSSAMLGMLMTRLYGIPLVTVVGGNLYRQAKEGRNKGETVKLGLIYKFICDRIFAQANRIIVDGPDIKAALIENHIDASKIAVISNSVDIDKFSPHISAEPFEIFLAAKGFVPSQRRRILFLGRIHDENGPMEFLEIIKRIKTVDGIVVGDGPALNKMKQAAREIDNHIFFTGKISDELVAPAMRSADVCVYPLVRIGGVSMVVPESMACGRCVVTTSAGSMAEVIDDGLNGFLAEVHDIPKMVSSVKRVLADDLLRNNMEQMARKFVLEKWNWESRVKDYLTVYQEVMGD